ncbi:hypothetical protein PR048_020004 [Dryococelus australis]|uniref:Uncharacterized protein n=1 Tax=Dryococelus australis TaxID=614101 RepID=A0ABQ9H5A2_9NEOP|nr:hypothetical protein PR048_020004 [Dryococelus australis]
MKITDELVTTPKIRVYMKDNTLLTSIGTGSSKSCIAATRGTVTQKVLVIENIQIDVLLRCDFIRKHRLIPDLYAKVATLILTHDKIIAVPFFDLDNENNIFFLNTIQ